jgi:glycerol-3-phosphate dehydrogenase
LAGRKKTKWGATMYDIIIIGAGVTGAAVARETSRYQAKICVLEKEEDVCCGTSKANSAIIHAGYDAASGSMMAKMNVRGNQMMDRLSEELDFPFIRCGSLLICRRKEDMSALQDIYDRGIRNGVEGLRILESREIAEMEPNITEEAVAALYAPTAGITCPYSLNIALAENAYTNGVEFKFNTEVLEIRKLVAGYEIETSQGIFKTNYIVNATGVYADKFHNMVCEHKIHITPRRGDYCLLDKSAGNYVGRIIFALPNAEHGKGVLITPTIHGNLLIGPTAVDIDNKEGVNTTSEGIEELINKAGLNVKNLPIRQVITSFAGLRAREDNHDFIVEEAIDAEGFIDCSGIESPGLSACPAIGEKVAEILRVKLNLNKKLNYKRTRKKILNPKMLSFEERKQLIMKNPAYGNIICRCEMITEGEIIDAIRRPLGAKSLDGIKRRTRAGMGRCQGGFCTPRVMEIIARECQVSMLDVTKSGGNSKIVVAFNKDFI